MKREIDKKIFVGILGLFLVIICIEGNRAENVTENITENVTNTGLPLKNGSLYIEERENDIIYIGGEGKLENSDLSTLLAANGLLVPDVVNLVIGNEITEIGYNCITGYKYLETLRLGDNVGYVRNGAVLNCSALEYIYIPGNIEKLGKDFLYGCGSFYIVTDGSAEELEEKLEAEPLFIFEKSGSYNEFLACVEESIVPYQSFSSASLAKTQLDAGKLHEGYVQICPYTTIEKGNYTIIIQGRNLDKITNDNIYIYVQDSDVEVNREEADIESDRITYTVSFSALATSVELYIYNDSVDGEIIKINGVDIYSNSHKTPASLECWWD